MQVEKLDRYAMRNPCQLGFSQKRKKVSAGNRWYWAKQQISPGKGLSCQSTWPWHLGRCLKAKFEKCFKRDTWRFLAKETAQAKKTNGMKLGKTSLPSRKICVTVTGADREWSLWWDTGDPWEGFRSHAWYLPFKPVFPKCSHAYRSPRVQFSKCGVEPTIPNFW